MAVFDPEVLTVILTTFLFLELNPILDIPSIILKNLKVFYTPKRGYLQLIYPDTSKNGKKKPNLLKQKQDIEEKVYALCDESCKRVQRKTFINSFYYDFYTGLVYVLLLSFACTIVAAVRYFLGYNTISLYYYTYLIVIVFIFICLTSRLNNYRSIPEYTAILLVYFLFSFFLSFGLLSLPESAFTFQLTNVWTDLDTYLSSIIQRAIPHYSLHIAPTLYMILLSLFLAYMSTLLLFPNIRYSQVEKGVTGSAYILAPIPFNIPFYLALSYIKPLYYKFVVGKVLFGLTINEENWNIIQFVFIFLYLLLRLWMFRPLMQSYFNLANTEEIKQDLVQQFNDIYDGKKTDEVHPSPFIEHVYKYAPIVAIELLSVPCLLFAILMLFFPSFQHDSFAAAFNMFLSMFHASLPTSFSEAHPLLTEVYQHMVQFANKNVHYSPLMSLSSSSYLNLFQYIAFFYFVTTFLVQLFGKQLWKNRQPVIH